jgi:hypothetical protein
MDPYLEPHWLDVRTALIGEARRALNRLLPEGLVARAEERITADASDEVAIRVAPDVRVFSQSPTEAGGGIAIEAPFKLLIEEEPLTERFIQILDKAGQLLAVLEFISPWNKRQPGLDEFRERRAKLLAGGVHVVEVDLVRAGNWRMLMRPQICPAGGDSLYRAVVRTGAPDSAGYLFPISLRHSLPEIPIPLRRGETPVKLPLQSLLDSVYSDGRYGTTLDYSQPLDPPLSEEDAVWARGRLAGGGFLTA